MNESPTLTKNEARPTQDYKLFTWERFIVIRKWAQALADELQAPVYLVGSALEKEIPRDIDVSVIFPVAVYESMFGKIPTEKEELTVLMDGVHMNKIRLKPYFEIMSIIKHDTLIDLKFCPDTWWSDKDKLLLASPKGIVPTE
jgi:hypothetical protein